MPIIDSLAIIIINWLFYDVHNRDIIINEVVTRAIIHHVSTMNAGVKYQ